MIEIKKLIAQRSTKILTGILIIFPCIIVFGIVSPSPQFSITMAEFNTAADFANAILGLLSSLGFYYIVLALLSSSALSKEIESHYLYFTLSVVSSYHRLFLYKILSITLIFTGILSLCSIGGFLAYSLLYLGELSFSLQAIGILFWGIGISFITNFWYVTLLALCNIMTEGNTFASFVFAVGTVILFIILSAIKGLMYYLPAWALDFDPQRNNIVLLVSYMTILVCSLLVFWIIIKKRRV